MLRTWQMLEKLESGLTEIANHYGKDHQLEKFDEELQELVEAKAEYDNDPYDDEKLGHFIEECADVMIMINHAVRLTRMETILNDVLHYKVSRQLLRILEENKKSC